MKLLLAVLLTLVSCSFAEEFDDNILNDLALDAMNEGEVSDRHPYVQCKIDLYDCIRLGQKGKLECMKDYKTCMFVLIPTVPPFVVKCNDDLKFCVNSASGIFNKAKCFTKYAKCLYNKGNVAVPPQDDEADDGSTDPTRHPYVQCKIDLYDCIKAGQSKLECMKVYKSCMAVLIPTIPPFVIQCKDNLKACVSSASGIIAKSKCFLVFAKCLKNGGPANPPASFLLDTSALVQDEGAVAPTRHPYFQCKIDLYKCFKEGEKGRLECLKDYKSCMAALLPTLPPLPPYVGVCKARVKQCLKGASGFLAKGRCFVGFAKCLKNKGQ